MASSSIYCSIKGAKDVGQKVEKQGLYYADLFCNLKNNNYCRYISVIAIQVDDRSNKRATSQTVNSRITFHSGSRVSEEDVLTYACAEIDALKQAIPTLNDI